MKLTAPTVLWRNLHRVTAAATMAIAMLLVWLLVSWTDDAPVADRAGAALTYAGPGWWGVVALAGTAMLLPERMRRAGLVLVGCCAGPLAWMVLTLTFVTDAQEILPIGLSSAVLRSVTNGLFRVDAAATTAVALVFLWRVRDRVRLPAAGVVVQLVLSVGLIVTSPTIPLLPSPSSPDPAVNRLALIANSGLAGFFRWSSLLCALLVHCGVIISLVRTRRVSRGVRMLAVLGLLAESLVMVVYMVERWRSQVVPGIGTDSSFLVSVDFLVSPFLLGLGMLLAWEELIRPRIERSRSGRLVIRSAPDGKELLRALPEMMGDPSAAVVVPTSAGWVDLRGRTYRSPEGNRAHLELRRDGKVIAAIDHDRRLQLPSGQLELIASTAATAIDNAQLDAQVLAGVEEIRASAQRLVNAGSEAQRAIQAELDVGPLREIDDAIAHLESGGQPADVVGRLQRALADVRRISRVVSPVTLHDEGLSAALADIVEEHPNVALQARVESRYSPAVEVTAYRVVLAESAAAAHVDVSADDHELVVSTRPVGPPLDAALLDRVAALAGEVSEVDGVRTVRVPVVRRAPQSVVAAAVIEKVGAVT